MVAASSPSLSGYLRGKTRTARQKPRELPVPHFSSSREKKTRENINYSACHFLWVYGGEEGVNFCFTPLKKRDFALIGLNFELFFFLSSPQCWTSLSWPLFSGRTATKTSSSWWKNQINVSNKSRRAVSTSCFLLPFQHLFHQSLFQIRRIKMCHGRRPCLLKDAPVRPPRERPTASLTRRPRRPQPRRFPLNSACNEI